MLSLMRRQAKSWFIKLALGLIAVVFVFWGVGSYSERRASRVALVNGQIITLAEYNQAYHNLLESARRRFGKALDEELVKQLNLRQQAVQQLISETLVLQAAERAGVVVGDEAVLADIEREPAFQRDGKFSPQLYQRVLAANRLQPAEFEASRRRSLIMQRIQSRVALASLVTPAEIKNYYQWSAEQIKISYVAFDPATYRPKMKVDEAELKTFFQANQEAYRVPERIEVDYLAFPTKDYLDQVSVNPKQVREIYDITQESYAEPEQVKLRHILFPVPAQANEEEINQAKAKAEEVAAQAKAGQDFSELAKANSQGAEAAKGGEVGWLPRGQLMPELEEAAFGLDKGQVSEPIKTRLGFHLLKVEDKKAARVKPFEEVKAEIEQSLKEDGAREKALRAAEQAYGLSSGVKQMSQLAAQINKQAQHVGPFSNAEPPQGHFSQPNLLEAAFDQPAGEVGPVIEGEDGYYLLLVTKKTPSYLPKLEEVASQVQEDFLTEQARKKAHQQAEEFLKQVRTGDWPGLAQKAGLKIEETEAFSRGAEIPGLGYDQALSEIAFRLTAAEPWPEQVFEVGGKFVVARFEERLEAGQDKPAESEEVIGGVIRTQRRQELGFAWLEALRQKASIEIDQRFL